MKFLNTIKVMFLLGTVVFLAFTIQKRPATGETEITKWQDGKPAALSVTYDDGYKNQFTVALPIMNQYKIPATFFIITGKIPGSQYQGKFIGRPVKTIIDETALTLTNKENFFERASAVAFLGYRGTLDYHTQAGSMYESGKVQQAYHLIDSLYKKVRNGDFQSANQSTGGNTQAIPSWDDIRKYAAEGHEFASHTITHPMTPVLDEVNLLYELEKSREDILKQLGPAHTFSAECPYGIENERVMEYAHKIYPALRNRMPEPWLEELNRSNRKPPGQSQKEYVQWQRGATTKTLMPQMKSWVDTVLTHNNNWLVLVIHGVDGNGYEALKHEDMDEYFQYMKAREDRIWIATFADVTKYMRERMSAKIQSREKRGKITVNLTHSLDKSMYNVPLTLKTYVSPAWKQVEFKQGNKNQRLQVARDAKGSYVLYRADPNVSAIQLSGILNKY